MIACACIRIKGSKLKNGFIKDNITGYIDVTRGDVKAFKTFVHIVIPNKHTTSGSELEFMEIIWS
jgi:hypothetical protein